MTKHEAIADHSKGALFGLAVGDALGTTVEFKPRGTFPPVTDITGGGPFNLPAGAWTDDTSMALCLAESLVECKGFDPHDQMDRYVSWHQSGVWSSTGKCFDIGKATLAALRQFTATDEPFSGSTDPHTAGNGSIMRLAPIPIYYRSDPDKAIHYAAESSRTTHATATCLDACKLFAAMIVTALSGAPKETVLSAPVSSDQIDTFHPAIQDIARGTWREKSASEIQGSGYVVKSLEAAVWCFAKTDSFEEAVLEAVNLGEDADTTGAVCGQLAGAFYGLEGIPEKWLQKLVMRDEIDALADRLVSAGR